MTPNRVGLPGTMKIGLLTNRSADMHDVVSTGYYTRRLHDWLYSSRIFVAFGTVSRNVSFLLTFVAILRLGSAKGDSFGPTSTRGSEAISDIQGLAIR